MGGCRQGSSHALARELTGSNVLRLTCTATGAGTRVTFGQAGSAEPLTVDLARLRQVMADRPHKDATAQPKPRSGLRPGPSRPLGPP